MATPQPAAWTRIPQPVGGLKRGGNRATPAADGAISRLKRWLIGTCNRPPTDPTRYLGEFCFRAEFRKDPETAFWTLLGLAMGREASDRSNTMVLSPSSIQAMVSQTASSADLP